jgi:hypothetical protein
LSADFTAKNGWGKYHSTAHKLVTPVLDTLLERGSTGSTQKLLSPQHVVKRLQRIGAIALEVIEEFERRHFT